MISPLGAVKSFNFKGGFWYKIGYSWGILGVKNKNSSKFSRYLIV